jgi:hypothetical protein
MISAKPKKSTYRRLKSTSPKKSKNRFYDYNSKKKDYILAIEEIKQIYTKLFANPSNLILNQLKSDNLKIYINLLNQKDLLALSIILSKYFYFSSIELASRDPNKGDEEETKIKKKEKYLYQNEKDKKNTDNEKNQTIQKIITSLGKNLFSSKNLNNLSLFGLNLEKKTSENISQGLAKNKSLESLIIKKCKMNIDSYEIFLKGLLNHEKIKFLDLSNNNFNDKYGNMISRIIIRQSQRRDQIIWSYGLRNEFPTNNDYTKGLISINLHGNKLGEKSTDKICYALCNDQYLRAVDLSDNNIDNNSCKKYIYMMRKNNTLLTIDLRNNPGYDENIHSRLVMKMSKNIHFLYQQYQSGAYTEEEFENLKDYIEISFFDVDIPQEIVEFYNQNLPEDDNEEEETENIQTNHHPIQHQEKFSNNEEEKDIIKLSNKSGNFNYNSLNKSKVSQADKSLIEENLRLKQQIIELKAINLQKQLKNNINEMNTDNKNTNNKDNSRTIEGDYKRVMELINELNELMNNIENKKNKKGNKDDKKKIFPKNQKQENEIIDNEQYLIEQERKEYERLQELERQRAMEKEKEEKLRKEREEKLKKEKEEKIKKEKEEKLKKEKEEKIKKEKEEKLKKENEERIKKENEERLKKENEEKIQKEKEIKLKNEKEEKLKKENEEKNKKENEEKIKKEKEKEGKPKKQKGLFDDDLEGSNKPIRYQELQAEPSEENNGSQLMDEDGNVFNFDDLTDEEKMSIIHQQLILQRLQEEAEARGEQFDPQEYLAYLEQQAEAEEEELMKKNNSNKLNKSF